MDVDSFRELLTPGGVRAVEAATGALDSGDDPVRVATEIRRRFGELRADTTAAAITQAQLRRRARAKFGADADRMWFTPDGLEQATRTEVANHRVTRFERLTTVLGRPPRVADLCCGIGGDLRALAGAGCEVTAFDRDPLTVEVARANVVALAINGVTVECLDVETLDLAGFDAAFLDPARRRDGRRTFDVRAYSPSWPYVTALLASMPAAVKVAPGIPHGLVPAGIELEWVSFEGDLKEAVLWSGALATQRVRRRATLLPSGATLVGDLATGAFPPLRGHFRRAGNEIRPQNRVGNPLRYLYEPDAAVVRAHLVSDLAEQVGGHLLDPTTAYVTSERLVATPFARAFEIEHVMAFSLKRLRRELRDRQVGAVTIMKRGSAVDVEQLRRDLRLEGNRHLIVVLALIDGRHHVLLVQPARADTVPEPTRRTGTAPGHGAENS